MRRKKLTTPSSSSSSSSQVEVWNAQGGITSGPSYEAFTMPTPRGLSTIGTPVDTSLTGRKRPASDSVQSHDSPVQQANVQNDNALQSSVGSSIPAQQATSAGVNQIIQSSVGSGIPAQQATGAGVKQIVLRLSSLKQSSPASGELSSLKCGESVTNKGTEVESQQWSNGTECIENRQAENSNRPDVESSSQGGAPARVMQMPEGIVAQKEDQCCGNDSGGCCVLDSVNGQPPKSGFGGQESFPHPTNPSWMFNANVCGSSCCVIPPSMNNQPANPCSACAASRFTSFQPGVPRAVHYISGEDVMVCPAPWVHEGREEIYHIPSNYVYPSPSGHCNGFIANNDLDMETQRHLEEQIAQEILLLSQKLANLQARYGARRLPAPNDTKLPVVLSCPLTPLLLDSTRRDVESNPRAPSASRSSQRLNHPEPRCQLEERKLGVGRSGGGTNIKPASPTSAQPPNRASETTTSIKSHPHSRPGNNTTTGFRAESGVVANDLSQGGCELGKANKNSASSPSRKRRDRQTEEHVDENSYSDDMKDLMKPEANVGGGYPDLGKRFDWVKTLRIAGVRSDDAPISLSKSVQTGLGASSDCLIDNDARASEVVLEERRVKGRPNGKRMLCSPDEMGGLDSRVNKHLLKAGLRRAPSSHWKPGPARNALRVKKKIFGSRSPRKDGGKRLRTRTLLDVNFTPYSAKVVPHEEKLGVSKERRECEEKELREDAQWQGEVADCCEAEFETFVGEDIASNVSRDEGEESQKRSSNAIATSPANKLFEAPVLSLMKASHAPKKTFIRCIDLMVASKKKNQLSKPNGHSKISCSHRRLDDSLLMDGCELAKDCQPDSPNNEGVVLQSTEAAEKQPLPKHCNEEPSTVTTMMETQDSNCSMRECCSAAAVTPVSNLASVLSRVIPKQMEHMDAAQLRARWEELIDALEKERLGLPKIKTSSRKMGGPSSPRDSGGVKRIAEQMKNHLRPPNPQKEEVEDASLTRGRPLWSKVEQQQEVVF